jgi:hypothetical protein
VWTDDAADALDPDELYEAGSTGWDGQDRTSGRVTRVLKWFAVPDGRRHRRAETAGPGGGLLGGVLPPVPTETFPAPRFGAGDTRPEPVDSTFAVSSIKVLGHTPE